MATSFTRIGAGESAGGAEGVFTGVLCVCSYQAVFDCLLLARLGLLRPGEDDAVDDSDGPDTVDDLPLVTSDMLLRTVLDCLRTEHYPMDCSESSHWATAVARPGAQAGLADEDIDAGPRSIAKLRDGT